jgi:membrane protease YdiL (CAAX protease family)
MENVLPEKHSKLKLSIILIFFIAYIVLQAKGGNADELNLNNENMILLLKILQVVAVVIIFIAPAILFSVFWTNQKIHYLGITKAPSFKVLLVAGVGMLLAMPLINWLSEINQQMQLPESFSAIETWMKSSESQASKLTEAFTKGTTVGSLILNLFVIAFMAALSEEMFFRGVLQKVLMECIKNKHVAIWVGAALFSAFHMQFYGFVPRMIMGAYLGYLFLWSGSLYPSILAHFLNNGMAVFLAWLVNRGVISVDMDKVGAESGQWILVVISFVLVSGSMYLVHRFSSKRIIK